MKQVSTSLNVFLLALVILLSSPALLAGEKHVIVTADVDVDAGLITLFGDFSDFDENPLVVTLNGVELNLLSVLPFEIMADLPGDIQPGTHRVAVCTEEEDDDDLCPDFDDDQEFNELDVTIGGGGPPGADGAVGLACWDTNGNGACDTDTEDPDGSGVCDVLDCQGADGEILIVTQAISFSPTSTGAGPTAFWTATVTCPPSHPTLLHGYIGLTGTPTGTTGARIAFAPQVGSRIVLERIDLQITTADHPNPTTCQLAWRRPAQRPNTTGLSCVAICST